VAKQTIAPKTYIKTALRHLRFGKSQSETAELLDVKLPDFLADFNRLDKACHQVRNGTRPQTAADKYKVALSDLELVLESVGLKSKNHLEQALRLLRDGIQHQTVRVHAPETPKIVKGKPVESKAAIARKLKLRRGGVPPEVIDAYSPKTPAQPETTVITEYNYTLRKDVAASVGVPLDELNADLDALDTAVRLVKDGTRPAAAAEKCKVAPADLALALAASGFKPLDVPELAYGDKTNKGIQHAPVFRWQRGTEPEEAPVSGSNGRRIQRLATGLMQLRNAGTIGDSEVAAAIRWRGDFEFAVEGARDPDMSGTGGGGVEEFLAATVDTVTKYRQACQAVGARGDQLLRSYVADGLSIVEISRRVSGNGRPSGSWQYRISKELSDTLFKLSDHYNNVDVISEDGLLPRRLTDAQIAARKAASAAYKIVSRRKSA
jgi:hypothetical protein